MPTALLTKHDRLLREAAAAAKAAREIAAKADSDGGRDMTDDERHDFDAKFAEATAKKADADLAKKDEGILAQAKALADLVGDDVLAEGMKDDLDAQAFNAVREMGGKSLGSMIVGSKEFKASMAPFLGSGRVPEKSRFQTDPIAVKSFIRRKSVFTGASSTSGGAFVTPDQSGLIEMLGRKDLRLRDLVSVRTTGSDSVEFVRQTSHTNNAAEVPEATSSAGSTYTTDGAVTTEVQNPNGGYKPEGAWAFERVTAVVKTIAEWVPATKRALADAGQLEGLINDELVKDLEDREDNQILNGNGSGENLTGILNTSNVQTQSYTTDIFTTVRKALTKVRTIGRVIPTGIVMNPADVETIDLAREGTGTGAFLGLGPFGIGPRTLWGVPIVESENITVKHALIGDFSKAVLWDRQQATVTMTDSHSDFFIRNLLAVLAEERVALGVTRPTAFVDATVAS